ncbi:MAG: hypothetical protein IPH38_15925 [Candidatus Microthrix sp.]|nr:hypothetical protein [Candidatus Microthrix sp.]
MQQGSRQQDGAPRRQAGPLSEIDQNAKPELIVESQYRPFDVHHLVADARVLGRPSRDMWTVHGSHQTYFVSRFVTEGASDGPVALVTPHIPDLDCSNGASGGGADVARFTAATMRRHPM